MEFTLRRDEISRRRRELPWERVEKPYVFDTATGKKSLPELFAGHGQLIDYHFMLGPDWKEGCHGCSFVSDHFDGSLSHISARDVTLVAVSRAPLAKIEDSKSGWAGDSRGSRRTVPTSIATIRFRSRRRTWPAARFTTTTKCKSLAAMKRPASACSIAIPQATCSILTRPTGAGSIP